MRNTKTVYAAVMVGLITAFSISNPVVAKSGQIGILGLFDVDSSVPSTVNTAKIERLGCKVRRSGVIGGGQGNIEIDDPNRFVLLACDGSLLESEETRGALNTMFSKGKMLALLEGDLTNMPDAGHDSVLSERQYILKISHYNNRYVDDRDQELNKLNQEASSRPDSYVTESSIDVNHASGMPTPDEIVVLYYDDTKQGDRFRKNNPDILSKISDFNKAHLNDFIYYVGQVAR